MSKIDMTNDVFAKHESGKAALRKMFPNGNMPENFRLYRCEVIGSPGNTSGIIFGGAEFRHAKSGPNKGRLSIMVPGTEIETVVTREELEKSQ